MSISLFEKVRRDLRNRKLYKYKVVSGPYYTKFDAIEEVEKKKKVLPCSHMVIYPYEMLWYVIMKK